MRDIMGKKKTKFKLRDYRMNKVFLSHSSSDKGSYVRLVAEKIGLENIEYDEWTFEEGERTIEEIERRIDESALFAFFISEAALKSDWVSGEVSRAKLRLSAQQLKKVYPIIIDPRIKYDDPRIPGWLKDSYNLKLIARPTVAARRLQAKLRELHWQDAPLSKERNSIFVGRNEILADFENRIDNIDLPKPACVIASGITKIGRSKVIKHALLKSSLIKSAFEPIKITMDRVDSIEDLIIKLYDTGLTSKCQDDLADLLSKPVSEKELLLESVLRDIHESKEVIFVEDNGCLVDYSREVAPWLINAINRLGRVNRPVICVSARYRVNPHPLRRHVSFYSIEVPELSPSERAGLLKRLLELYEVNIDTPDFLFFSEQLRGYPEEAYFCADLILDNGIKKAMSESYQITEFNEERASLLLRKYESNSEILDFIYLLSEFEFVSVKFLFEIADETNYYPVLEELVTHMICDYIGAEQEYVRLNDTIRDLIKRNRLSLSSDFKQKLRKHVQLFVSDTDKFDRDSSDFFYSIKEALVTDRKIEDKFLAPSHILRTIKELYQKRENLKRVVKFADMLLAKESSLDPKVSQDARYYLCLSLARQKDRRVLVEVQKVVGPEHDFVLGYYYRLCGRHTEAISRLSKLVDTPYISSRAKRELVQVYLYIEEFDKAVAMARENYESNRGNQFPLQSYLNCLLNDDDLSNKREEILRLIGELDQIGSRQSREMTLIAKAMYAAKNGDGKIVAYNFIDDAIALDAESPYPQFAKFDIALRFGDAEIMLEILTALEKISSSRTFSKNTVAKNKAYYYAVINDIPKALQVLDEGLENYPPDTKEKLINKVRKIAERRRLV